MDKYLRIISHHSPYRQLLVNRYCSASQLDKKVTDAKKGSFEGSKVGTKVPGLSNKVFNITAEEVGPGASKLSKYKNPEYFCYNKMSYFEAEIEMLKFRLPQPSSIKE